jgi:hypothetical protein
MTGKGKGKGKKAGLRPPEVSPKAHCPIRNALWNTPVKGLFQRGAVLPYGHEAAMSGMQDAPNFVAPEDSL